MIYNKTEKRVRSYISILKNRMFSPLQEVECYTMQLESYTDRVTKERCKIESYPYLFGKEWEDTKFVFTLNVPNITEDVFLSFPLGTDSLVEVDGVAYSNCNPSHPEINFSPLKGKTVSVAITCWDAYRFPGCKPIDDDQVLTVLGKNLRNYPITLDKPYLSRKNEESYNLYYDLVALTEIYDTLDENTLLRERGYSRLHSTLLSLRITSHKRDEWEEDAKRVRETTTVLLSMKNGSLAPLVPTVGMSHLDHAWLWPIRETYRKAVRTLSGTLRLMDEYPEMRFLFTQPEQLEKAFTLKPELKKKVMDAYERGQFEPNGVGLVEADGMLSTGEGQIRNLLYGRELTSRLFPGYRADTYILPDSFGYNGNLPQILKECGVEYFVTSKIGWNDTTRFPYDIFSWKGIDGSEVKTAMIQGGYEGTNSPTQIKAMWKKVQHKDVQSALFRTVGEGDGGGGVRRDDLELIKRLYDTQGCPKTYWTTTTDAMKEIFSTSYNLPVYDGELYFELHRGTYTSQAKMKKGYRRVTTLLHNVEYLLSLAWAEGSMDDKEIYDLASVVKSLWWQTVVYQFHDILPGSCVGCVYEETNSFYDRAEKQLVEIEKKFLGEGKDETYLNLTPFSQEGIAPYSTGKRKISCRVSADANYVETNWGSVKFDKSGAISSVLSHGRELVGSEMWNVLCFGEDVPLNWDAWDVEKDSLDFLKECSLPFVSGERKGKIGESSFITQRVIIYKDKERIDFETEVDWHEEHKILRSDFSVGIRAKEAFFDIPFGYIKRPTTFNNQTERAQFESPALKWVALSDEGLIVSLMSDCKYGFSAKEGVLSISLLRSPKAPDREADMGKHSFTYSIYFGAEDLCSVMAEAEAINNPLLPSIEMSALISVKGEHFSLETVKLSEDGKGICFRVVENSGVSGEATFSFSPGLDGSSLRETNMLEEDKLNTTFNFHPFEIKTYKIGRNKV